MGKRCQSSHGLKQHEPAGMIQNTSIEYTFYSTLGSIAWESSFVDSWRDGIDRDLLRGVSQSKYGLNKKHLWVSTMTLGEFEVDLATM